MKTTKKIVSALLCAAILLMGAVTPAGSVNAEAKAKTRNVTIGGIVFKIPVSYKSNKDLKIKGYKIYIKTDESDYTTGKLSFLMGTTIPADGAEMNFNDYDDNDMASLIQGSANAASDMQGEITNFKKKKIAGYQGIIFDYTVESDSVSVKERAMAIANKKAKKIVILSAVEYNGDGSGLSIINTIAKTAKKK